MGILQPQRLKVISAMTAFVFTLTSVIHDAPAQNVPASVSDVTSISREARYESLAGRIEIPESLGSVRERFVPPEASIATVIHIQDAHVSLEAQQNIRRILQLLSEQYGVNTVFLEGAFSKLRPENLKIFKDESVNAKAAELFVKDSLIGGPERFLLDRLNAGKDAAGYGVEDQSLYAKNLRQFRFVLNHRNFSDKFLSGLKSRILTKSSRLFNKALKEFFREWVFYSEARDEMMRQVEALAARAKETLKVDLHSPRSQIDWPQLTRFVLAKDFENGIDVTKLAEEKNALEKWITENKIEAGEFAQILSGIDKPQTQFADPRRAAELFYDAASSAGFQFEIYPGLSKALGRTILLSEIRADALFDEIERLTRQVFDGLAEKEEEKNLLAIYTDYLTLKKLFALEMTRDDYENAATRSGEISPSALAARLAGIRAGGSGKCVKVFCPLKTAEKNPGGTVGAIHEFHSPVRKIDVLFQKGLDFYKVAVEREAAIYKRLTGEMTAGKTEAAVLVTGGFHSKGIAETLKKSGLAYVEIAPKITDLEETTNYLNFMTLKNIPGAKQSSIRFLSFTNDFAENATVSPETTSVMLSVLGQTAAVLGVNGLPALNATALSGNHLTATAGPSGTLEFYFLDPDANSQYPAALVPQIPGSITFGDLTVTAGSLTPSAKLPGSEMTPLSRQVAQSAVLGDRLEMRKRQSRKIFVSQSDQAKSAQGWSLQSRWVWLSAAVVAVLLVSVFVSQIFRSPVPVNKVQNENSPSASTKIVQPINPLPGPMKAVPDKNSGVPLPSLSPVEESWQSYKIENNEASIRGAILVTINWLKAHGYPHPELLDQYGKAVQAWDPATEDGSAFMFSKFTTPENPLGVRVVYGERVYPIFSAIQKTGSQNLFFQFAAIIAREVWGLRLQEINLETRKIIEPDMLKIYLRERKKMLSRELRMNDPKWLLFNQTYRKDFRKHFEFKLAQEVFEDYHEWETLAWGIRQDLYNPAQAGQDLLRWPQNVKSLDSATEKILATNGDIHDLIYYEFDHRIRVDWPGFVSGKPKEMYGYAVGFFVLSEIRRYQTDGVGIHPRFLDRIIGPQTLQGGYESILDGTCNYLRNWGIPVPLAEKGRAEARRAGSTAKGAFLSILNTKQKKRLGTFLTYGALTAALSSGTLLWQSVMMFSLPMRVTVITGFLISSIWVLYRLFVNMFRHRLHFSLRNFMLLTVLPVPVIWLTLIVVGYYAANRYQVIYENEGESYSTYTERSRLIHQLNVLPDPIRHQRVKSYLRQILSETEIRENRMTGIRMLEDLDIADLADKMDVLEALEGLTEHPDHGLADAAVRAMARQLENTKGERYPKYRRLVIQKIKSKMQAEPKRRYEWFQTLKVAADSLDPDVLDLLRQGLQSERSSERDEACMVIIRLIMKGVPANDEVVRMVEGSIDRLRSNSEEERNEYGWYEFYVSLLRVLGDIATQIEEAPGPATRAKARLQQEIQNAPSQDLRGRASRALVNSNSATFQPARPETRDSGSEKSSETWSSDVNGWQLAGILGAMALVVAFVVWKISTSFDQEGPMAEEPSAVQKIEPPRIQLPPEIVMKDLIQRLPAPFNDLFVQLFSSPGSREKYDVEREIIEELKNHKVSEDQLDSMVKILITNILNSNERTRVYDEAIAKLRKKWPEIPEELKNGAVTQLSIYLSTLNVLRAIGRPAFQPVLDLTKSSSASVQTEGVHLLGAIGADLGKREESFQVLLQFARMSELKPYLTALASLGQYNDRQETVEVFLTALAGTNQDAVGNALNGLKNSPVPGAREGVERFLTRRDLADIDPDGKLTQNARQVLSTWELSADSARTEMRRPGTASRPEMRHVGPFTLASLIVLSTALLILSFASLWAAVPPFLVVTAILGFALVDSLSMYFYDRQWNAEKNEIIRQVREEFTANLPYRHMIAAPPSSFLAAFGAFFTITVFGTAEYYAGSTIPVKWLVFLAFGTIIMAVFLVRSTLLEFERYRLSSLFYEINQARQQMEESISKTIRVIGETIPVIEEAYSDLSRLVKMLNDYVDQIEQRYLIVTRNDYLETDNDNKDFLLGAWTRYQEIIAQIKSYPESGLEEKPKETLKRIWVSVAMTKALTDMGNRIIGLMFSKNGNGNYWVDRKFITDYLTEIDLFFKELQELEDDSSGRPAQETIVEEISFLEETMKLNGNPVDLTYLKEYFSELPETIKQLHDNVRCLLMERTDERAEMRGAEKTRSDFLDILRHWMEIKSSHVPQKHRKHPALWPRRRLSLETLEGRNLMASGVIGSAFVTDNLIDEIMSPETAGISGPVSVTEQTPVALLTNSSQPEASDHAIVSVIPAGMPKAEGEAAVSAFDTDGDFMSDAWETAHGFDPADASDARLDADSDGIPNRWEYLAGTDPRATTSSLTNDQLADLAQGQAIFYFWNEAADADHGYFVPDYAPSDASGGSALTSVSVAGEGFKLASYMIADERGLVSHEDAYNRVVRTLEKFRELQAPEKDGISHKHGVFFHFMDYDGVGNSEVSTVDHALLLQNALLVGSYYKGTEVERLANEIYDATDWTFFQAPDGFLYQAWYADSIYHWGSTADGGAWSNPAWGYTPEWDRYSEETSLYVMAAASPTHPIADARNVWDRISRGTVQYVSPVTGQSFESYMHVGAYFTHVFSHSVLDLEGKRDDSGRDYFDNSKTATLVNRQFTHDLSDLYPSEYETYAYDHQTGAGPAVLSSANRSNGLYEVLQPIFSGNLEEIRINNDSGTLAPAVYVSALPFAPGEVEKDLQYLFNNRNTLFAGESIWDEYGLVNAYNSGQALSGTRHISRVFIGVDHGPIPLQVENYFTGLPWKYAMRVPAFRDGMAMLGFTDYERPFLMNFDDTQLPYNFTPAGGGFGPTPGTIVDVNIGDPFPALPYGPQGHARKMTGGAAGDGTYEILGNHSIGNWDRVSFWIRGEIGGELVKLGLKDVSGHEVQVNIEDYLSGGITDRWREVRIPLSKFPGVRLVNMDNISFTFRSAGTIYVDDIAFLGDEFAPSAVQNFTAVSARNTVTLNWEPNPEPDVVGYRILRKGPQDQSFTDITPNGELLVSHTFQDNVGTEAGTFVYQILAVDNAEVPNTSQASVTTVYVYSRFDASRDKIVSPLDALVIINDVNANHPHGFVSSFDVYLDGSVDSQDVLLVINYLNARADAFPEGESVTEITGPVPDASGREVFTLAYDSGRREQVDAATFKLTVTPDSELQPSDRHSSKDALFHKYATVSANARNPLTVRHPLDTLSARRPVDPGDFDRALLDLVLNLSDEGLPELSRAELRGRFAAIYGTSFDAVTSTAEVAKYIFAERISSWPELMAALMDIYCPDEAAVLRADEESRQALKAAALKAVEPGYEWLVDWVPSANPVDLYYTLHQPAARAGDFRSLAVLDPKDRVSLFAQGQTPDWAKAFETELDGLAVKDGVKGLGRQVKVIPAGKTSREIVRQVQALLGKPETEAAIQRAFADSRDEVLDRVGLRGAHLLKSPELAKDIVAIHLEIALLKQQDFKSLQRIDVETWMTEHGYTLEALARNVLLAVAAIERAA